MFNGFYQRIVSPAVRERIRGDVKNSHYMGVGEIEG